jgi:hypothetical protein
MENETGKICTEGLAFFGRTNRFISHEIKNILAIISESLGLMDELLELAEAGRELRPEKLRSLSQSVIEEVERANGIIKNMNAFGHSVDAFLGEVDVNQTISLMIKLLRLDPSSRKTAISFQETDANSIYSSPFFLGNLIYSLLNYTVFNAGPKRDIGILVSTLDHGIRITLNGMVNTNRSRLPEDVEIMARALSADLSFDDSFGELHLNLPSRIKEGLVYGFLKEKK